MGDRYFDAVISHPEENLADTAEFSELAKDETDRLGDPNIWVHLDSTEFVPAEARGK
jgi:hypothetical protein